MDRLKIVEVRERVQKAWGHSWREHGLKRQSRSCTVPSQMNEEFSRFRAKQPSVRALR